jgi:hypothetical protein
VAFRLPPGSSRTWRRSTSTSAHRVHARLQNVSKTAAELRGLARSFADVVLVPTCRRSSESTNWRASSPCWFFACRKFESRTPRHLKARDSLLNSGGDPGPPAFRGTNCHSDVTALRRGKPEASGPWVREPECSAEIRGPGSDGDGSSSRDRAATIRTLIARSRISPASDQRGGWASSRRDSGLRAWSGDRYCWSDEGRGSVRPSVPHDRRGGPRSRRHTAAPCGGARPRGARGRRRDFCSYRCVEGGFDRSPGQARIRTGARARLPASRVSARAAARRAAQAFAWPLRLGPARVQRSGASRPGTALSAAASRDPRGGGKTLSSGRPWTPSFQHALLSDLRMVAGTSGRRLISTATQAV